MKNIYPIISRTYFADKEIAWKVAQRIGRIANGWAVVDYGIDNNRVDEPFYIETAECPYMSSGEILQDINKH